MKERMRAFPQLALAALCAAAAGCAADGSRFPVVEAVRPADADMTCAATGDELARVAALRVEIARERGELNRSDTGYVLLDALLFPPLLLLEAPIVAARASQRNARYDAAAAAAEARLSKLLEARREASCASGPDADREAALAAALAGTHVDDASSRDSDRRARAEAVAAYLTQD